MPDSTVEAPPAARAAVRDRVRAFAVRHWLFGLVLGAGAVLRTTVMLGYRPVQWFNDSYSYVTAAVTGRPETIRPSGYPLLLAALQPLHAFTVVALAQHLLGLATGVLVYSVLRVRGLRPGLAVLAAVPVLFDAYEVQLEHLVMADTLFMFLVTAAIAVVCMRNQPGWIAVVAAGLLLGLAVAVRTDGRPLLVVAAACLLVRRVGWRPVAGMVLAGLLPIAAYVGWFHAARGAYALTEGDGAFLYSRVMAFADCAKMNPPATLRPLCDSRPPSRRLPSAAYVWRPNPLRTAAGNPWGARGSSLGTQFALLAVRKQPLSYLAVTAKDVARTFTWSRSTRFPDPATAFEYQFTLKDSPVAYWAPLKTLNAYQPGDLTTRVAQPYASLLVAYQRYFYLRGPLLLLILLAGAAFVVTGRQRGAPGLLPWCVAVTLIVIPPATAGFTYRYVLAAVPCACVAAGLAAVPGRIRRPALATTAGASHHAVPGAGSQHPADPPAADADAEHARVQAGRQPGGTATAGQVDTAT